MCCIRFLYLIQTTLHECWSAKNAGPELAVARPSTPAKPAYLRVKIWRRLQGIGAIAVKCEVNCHGTNSSFNVASRSLCPAGHCIGAGDHRRSAPGRFCEGG